MSLDEFNLQMIYSMVYISSLSKPNLVYITHVELVIYIFLSYAVWNVIFLLYVCVRGDGWIRPLTRKQRNQKETFSF